MGSTAASRPSWFSAYPHRKTAQPLPYDPPHVPLIDQFQRPFTALTWHRPHELSEIGEVSASSKATLARRYSVGHLDGTTSAAELERDSTESGRPDLKNLNKSLKPAKINEPVLDRPVSAQCEIHSLAPSALSLPMEDIPQRRSSMSAVSHVYSDSRHASLQELQTEIISGHELALLSGKADSPVRHSLAQGAQSSDAQFNSPVQTFVRTPLPFYLLDSGNVRNPRLEMTIRLPSPLFVSGGTVEGQIELKIDATTSKKMKSKSLLISRLSVDLIGVEEVEHGGRQIFLSLATELFSVQHPPPATMVVSQTPEKGSELYWQTQAATATIPFCIHLPLKGGPPPYSSRQASIRYLLCPSAVMKIGEKRSAVRQAWTIQLLPVYDPERALASLPSPLLASDTLTLTYKPVLRSVKVTAGLHRQTWVSGSAIFTDVHIVNNSDKIVKRIELQLEKSLLWFPHSAAGTVDKRASRLRLPNKIDTEIVHKSLIKRSKQWNGVASQASELRTCELEIPKGHITIGGGRFFEVRYFVKITVVVTKGKSISVQLPVTIIHINSLDIMPNSVAQVAASIEAKRSMVIATIGESIARLPHTPGQAFSAARRQSFGPRKHLVNGMNVEDMSSLKHELDHSPRRLKGLNGASNETAHGESTNGNNASATTSCYRHLTLRPSCYHCHLLYTEHATKHFSDAGPRLPRLQVSTSGLGFSESEFEIPPDSPPRKVMLSEQERIMIKQQRELGIQRQMSRQRKHNSYFKEHLDSPGADFIGFKNVAAVLHPNLDRTATLGSNPKHTTKPSRPRNASAHVKRNSLPPPTMARRNRSRVYPERMRGSYSDSDPGRTKTERPTHSVSSTDHADRRPMTGYSLAENDVFGPNRPVTDRKERLGRRRSARAQ